VITAKSSPAAPPQFQLRCALAYAAPISVNGILLPYLPVWLHSLEFSAPEIGTILAVQVVLRVLMAPLTGPLAGMVRQPTTILTWSAALSLVAFLGLFISHQFPVVLFVIGLQAALFAPFAPTVEAMTISGVRRWGLQYGFMRVWGSIGFVAATLAASGFSSLAGPDVIPVMVTIVLALAVGIGWSAPRVPMATKPAARAPRASLLQRPDIHALLIAAAVIQASHGMFYGFSTIQWQALGFSNGMIAAFWSAGIFAEIMVFFAAGRLAKRLSPWTMMQIGCVVAIIRWTLFPFEWSAVGYVLLQVGHAFSFAFTHLGLQYRLAETVDEDRQASAQGAYVFYNGAFLAAATLLSGIIYRSAGLNGYFAMTVLALAGLGILHVAARLQPQRSAVGG
jgi:MFS transporter, PPP family, 3-phenylpropionic acid transporter